MPLYPKRTSVVPANVAWFELNTGKPLPMFSRYVFYFDSAMQAITAAATLSAPALVVVKRVPLPPPSVEYIHMTDGSATDPFARYLDYVDNSINALTDYANAHGHPTPLGRSQIPSTITMVDVNTGLPTDNHAQYLQNADMILQSLIAAGV